MLERDWVQEVLEVDGQRLRYQQFEGSFTQPNGGVNQHMLSWRAAKAVGTRPQGPGDLLELYCGNGNFTVALAPLFGRVLATEMSKTSVRAAHTNLADNNVANVTMVRMASEEISDALAGGREYRRMAGVGPGRLPLLHALRRPTARRPREARSRWRRASTTSSTSPATPETLRANVAALAATHRIAAAAAFDQFPYTHHLECGLLLQRR